MILIVDTGSRLCSVLRMMVSLLFYLFGKSVTHMPIHVYYYIASRAFFAWNICRPRAHVIYLWIVYILTCIQNIECELRIWIVRHLIWSIFFSILCIFHSDIESSNSFFVPACSHHGILALGPQSVFGSLWWGAFWIRNATKQAVYKSFRDHALLYFPFLWFPHNYRNTDQPSLCLSNWARVRP